MKKLSFILLLTLTSPALLAQTYPIVWTNPVNVTVNGDNSLTKVGAVQWDATIVSQNTIMGGSDGSIQFAYAAGYNVYMVSLSRFNNDYVYYSSDYSIYINYDDLHAYSLNSYLGAFGKVVANDVLKIAREGNVINFYKNGVVFKTITLASNTDNLRIDVSVNRGNVPAIQASFRPALIVQSQITHPGLANNDGGIALQAQGGVAPVTYTWSTSETTSSVNNKSRANGYTVTVTDALSRSITRTYGLAYPISWTNITNISVNGDNSLTKTGTVSDGSGASSLNTLQPGVDGWIEYVVNEPASSYFIGLSRVDKNTDANMNYCWYVWKDGSIYVYESGANRGFIGNLFPGDVLRIAREGSNVKYYLNGVLKYTTVASAAVPLVVDVNIQDNFGPTPIVSASFDKEIRVKPSLTLPTSANTGGSIALNIQGVYTPATISWTSGETNNIITNKSRNKYTVTVADAASRTFTRSYQLGYPVNWTDLQNTALTANNTLYAKTAVTTWANAASSSNTLPASTDGWVEFTVPLGVNRLFLGLAQVNSVAYHSFIDYAFLLTDDGDVTIYERGANRGVVASQTEGDVYTIAREGSNVKYYINGAVVRTIAVTPTYQLIVDACINAGSLSVVTTSFTRAPQTFYARANGPWTTPATWSLVEGGPAATVYPGVGDIVFVKGYAVTINSGVFAGDVTVTTNTDATSLLVDGVDAALNVKGNVMIKGENNQSMAKALVVKNNALIKVQP